MTCSSSTEVSGIYLASSGTSRLLSRWVVQLTDGRYKACWAFGVKWKVKMTEEDTNELIRYETVTSPGLRTYSEIHFVQGSDAGQTELREVMKTPLGLVGRTALALIGKFSSEEVSANVHRLKEVMEM